MLETDVLLILMVVAFAAGFIDAVSGGGGLLAVPALIASGLPINYVLGTNKFAATFGSFQAARAYMRRNIIQPKLWITCMICTFVGGSVGALSVQLLSDEVLRKVLPLAILCVAIYMLFRKQPAPSEIRTVVEPGRKKSGLLGSILGFYDGFIGPGSGAFWTTLIMMIYRVDLVHASGIARLMNFISNLSAVITFMILGEVHYTTGLAMATTLALGSYIGAHSAIYLGEKFIRPVFLVVVSTTACVLAYEEWLSWTT